MPKRIPETTPPSDQDGHPVADGQKPTVSRNSFKSLDLGLSLGGLIVLVEGRVGSISRTLRRYSGLRGHPRTASNFAADPPELFVMVPDESWT
jgi:hypothetical protein